MSVGKVVRVFQVKPSSLAFLIFWTFSSRCLVCIARGDLTRAWYDRECRLVEESDSYLLMPLLRRIDACLRSRLRLSFLPVSHVTLCCSRSV